MVPSGCFWSYNYSSWESCSFDFTSTLLITLYAHHCNIFIYLYAASLQSPPASNLTVVNLCHIPSVSINCHHFLPAIIVSPFSSAAPGTTALDQSEHCWFFGRATRAAAAVLLPFETKARPTGTRTRHTYWPASTSAVHSGHLSEVSFTCAFPPFGIAGSVVLQLFLGCSRQYRSLFPT